ncbi:tetratricopeptide repeat protein [Zavarzinia sp. CC-PAN008]|uniref:tetratricopeptide repeat protein n=1 Tax=Zavarzinia sp. CC-PAN008 TaxID=3243332 RepID=UPI003F74A2FC
MTLARDERGLELSGASTTAAAHFSRAGADFLCFVNDPLGDLQKALQDSPDFAMAHAMLAYIFLMATEPPAMRYGLKSAAELERTARTERERGHSAACNALARGRWHEAGRILEDIAIRWPHDLQALQFGHQLDFFVGDARMLRDRLARALPGWSSDMPGYHGLLGMHAFGLEETGDYARAEAAGRAAIELQPRDGWAQHAVAHVMEMEGRQREGIAWMRDNQANWAVDTIFGVHNWWHLALYHLDLDEVDAVLDLYDTQIHAAPSTVALQLVDAAAMLWRLHLLGVDIGDRWTPVAQAWAPMAGASTYAFNDAHAMMAAVGAGRSDIPQAIAEAQSRALSEGSDNAGFVADVGQPVVRAIQAFGEGRYGEAVDLLRPIRHRANRFGGSHAQRDVIDLTLIEAALRDRQGSLARALAAERLALKPHSAPNQRLAARAAAI